MKTQTADRVLSILLLLVSTAMPGLAASFSAELVDTRAGQTLTSPFNCQDKSYRFEVVENGQTLIIMVDGQSGAMRLLNPSEKAYYEAGPDDPMSLFANPFALYGHYARTKDVRTERIESVGGVSCKKQVVYGGEQVFVTGWVSDDFDIPLKVQTQLDGRTVELRNIKRGPQDPALFAVPADYHLTVVKEEPEPQPAWAGQVAGAPLLTPPFEKKLAAGGIVRVRPQAGRWLEITGTNVGQGQGTFTSAPFKGGKYLGDGSMGTVIVDPGDSGAMTDGAGPDAADEIIVRVNQGTMTIKTAFVAPQRTGPRAAAAAEEAAPSTPAVAPELSAEVSAPDSAEVAVRLEVSWKGPANRDDYISVARPDQPPGAYVNFTNVREGNPLKVWMPSDPGKYEVRYILGRGAKLLAKSPITVNPVTAEVRAPASAAVGAELEVQWSGLGYPEDFVSVARANQPPGAYVNFSSVRQGSPLKLRAPREPGTYEVRYVLGRGNRLLAKTTITIGAP